MRLTSKVTNAQPKRRSLALVEVVAAIVLLSTVVCSLLVAHSRSVRSSADLDLREQASQLAQELIVGWKLSETELTVPAEGTFEGHPSWSWERHIGTATPRVKRGEWVSVHLDLLYRDGVHDRRIAASIEWVESRHDEVQ